MAINDCDVPMIKKNFLFSYQQNFTSCLLFRRATWGNIGCNVNLEGCKNQIVYIKDYWRLEEEEKEREIYWTLEEKNVPNISRFYYRNDVCHKVHRNNDSEEAGDDFEEISDNSQQVNDNSQQVPNGQEGPEKVSKIRTSKWALIVSNTHTIIYYWMVLD